MVSCSGVSLNVQESVTFSPKRWHELSASVWSDVFHNSKPENPVVDEDSSTGRSMTIEKRNGFCPTGAAVDDNEEMCHALTGWQRADKVNMATAEPGAWKGVIHQWAFCVMVNFRCLTSMTFFTPPAYVTLHAMPHKTLGDGLLSTMCTCETCWCIWVRMMRKQSITEISWLFREPLTAFRALNSMPLSTCLSMKWG